MKKLILILSTALICLLLFVCCDASAIKSVANAAYDLRSINGGYGAEEMIETAKTNAETVSAKINNLNLEDTSEQGQAALDEMRDAVSACVQAILDSLNAKGLTIREVVDQRITAVADSNYCDYSYLIQLFMGSETSGGGYHLILATNSTNTESVLTRGLAAYVKILNRTGNQPVNMNNSDGFGGRVKDIFLNDIFGQILNHVEAGYVTYGDVLFTAMFIDMVYTAYDIAFEEDVNSPNYINVNNVDVKAVLANEDFARILNYFYAIEYIYDVDFGIAARLRTLGA